MRHTRRIGTVAFAFMLAGCTLFTDFGGLSQVEVTDAATSSEAAVGEGGTPPTILPPDAGSDATESCATLTNGLLGSWTFDGASVNGGVVKDTSGNGRDATLLGAPAPTVTAGHFGEALQYPASNGAHVSLPTLPLDGTPGAVNTFSFWFYRQKGSVDDTIIYAPSSPRYDLWLNGTRLCFNTGNDDCWGIDDSAALFDRWVHVVALFKNGATTGSELYIDGVKRSLLCLPPYPCDRSATAQPPVTFGGATDYFFHGKLDDVRVYTRALTASEVTSLFQGACR